MLVFKGTIAFFGSLKSKPLKIQPYNFFLKLKKKFYGQKLKQFLARCKKNVVGRRGET